MLKKKSYYAFSVFFIIFLTLAGINVRAHPPDDMSLEYNPGTNILKVSISHGVASNASHYVISVVVRVNGSVDQTHFYTSQPDLIFFIYEYTVITKNGSIFEVTATCSVGGSITKTLGSVNDPTDGAIPGYMGLYIVLFVSVIPLLITIRKKIIRL